ncbi:MAG: magnesium transporter CorA [Gammaproteobacteria bacterium]|jgi:Mg2+ and Co2+ transporter CorA|nr:magnesium transporter CorA [Gammaproteobacteria bacterium]
MIRLLHIDQTSEVCDIANVKGLPEKGYLWLILSRDEKFDLGKWVLDLVGKPIHPRHLDDITQKNHPSYYDYMSNYDILIFRTATRLEIGPRRGLESTTFLLFNKLLVSIHESSEKDFDHVYNYVIDPDRILPPTPALALETCLDYTVNHLSEFKAPLETQMNSWQKRLLKVSRGKAMDWTELLEFKADLRKLKAICEEQNDTLSAWRNSLRNDGDKPYFHGENILINLNDLIEHSHRMLNLSNQSQTELESLLQLHFTILGHRTNEIMRTIAIITGIFMPANLIAGIYGMNFTNLPEISNPHGLIHVLALMAGITGLSLAVFRWLKWV